MKVLSCFQANNRLPRTRNNDKLNAVLFFVVLWFHHLETFFAQGLKFGLVIHSQSHRSFLWVVQTVLSAELGHRFQSLCLKLNHCPAGTSLAFHFQLTGKDLTPATSCGYSIKLFFNFNHCYILFIFRLTHIQYFFLWWLTANNKMVGLILPRFLHEVPHAGQFFVGYFVSLDATL